MAYQTDKVTDHMLSKAHRVNEK